MPKEFNFERNSANSCVHTKHIYNLLDMPKNEEVYKKLNKHIESCAVCAEEFKKFQQKTMAAQIFIPKVSMDRDLRQSFEREVGELFKVMNLNEREALRRNVKEGFNFIDSMGVDFLKNLASKNMLKAYAFALGIYIALKLFL